MELQDYWRTIRRRWMLVAGTTVALIAIAAIWTIVDALNGYITENEPWALAKDPEQTGRLGTVLYTAADARNLGYAVEVVEEGVTSFDVEAHRDALRELEKTLGAKIVHSHVPA